MDLSVPTDLSVPMDLPRSAAAAADLIVLAAAASTNDVLLSLAGEAPEFTVVMTTDQTSGRGRLGRTWLAPAGHGLAASVLLTPRSVDGGTLSTDVYGWLPLLAGLAMTRSVAAVLPHASVTLKWPNDVLVGGKKVAGLLAELVQLVPGAGSGESVEDGAAGSRGYGAVIGSGVNLELTAGELPTPVSTSLTLEGARGGAQHGNAPLEGGPLLDAVLGGYLEALKELYADFLAAGADAAASGLAAAVSERCSSLGQQVRVELPGGSMLVGMAVDLDSSGRLRVRTPDDAVQAVAAGDVTHLRYE